MYRDLSAGLFRSEQLSRLIESNIESAVTQAKQLSIDIFEANGDSQIVEHIISQYQLAPLTIDAEQKEVTFEEVKVDAWKYPGRMLFEDSPRPFPIPGYRVTWTIPFKGTSKLFDMEPSTSIMNFIQGSIDINRLKLSAELPADAADAANIEQQLKGQLNTVNKMTGYINNDLLRYSRKLHDQIATAVSARRQELDNILKLKSALKVNVETKQAASPLNQIPVELQTISPLSETKDDPGAFITDEAYASIIKAIRNMGASMESSRASESKDEEALRDTMLVGLNASMSSGSAGAELFRKKGKTDISIIFENKAAFIAECKLWKGEQYILDGVDQLLGYLTWRDAKTAMIIFNRHNKNFTAIQAQVGSIFTKHPAFIKKIAAPQGEGRFVFKKPDDDNKLITLHVFLFDVFEGEAT